MSLPRIGLTRERVIAAAVELLEKTGAADFSMRALAESLNIRAASLYNHIESMETLQTEMCIYALKMQEQAEQAVIDTRQGDEAIRALAYASRKFAGEHRELYWLIMRTAAHGEGVKDASRCIVEPYFAVLQHRMLTETQKIHWQRVLRGIVHGFIAQEEAGFFSHLSEDAEESFRTAVECYIDGLKQAESRNRHES